MKHLKTYKLFESVSEKTVREILFDITDDSNFNVEIKEVDNHLEVYITRGSYFLSNSTNRATREIPGAPTPPGSGYSANLFLWFEIKDTIISLCEYVYKESGLEPIENRHFQQWYLQQEHFSKSPFRMKNGGTEFGVGWHKAEDFTLGDFISFTGLKLIIKL
jgi:hypothetical protein